MAACDPLSEEQLSRLFRARSLSSGDGDRNRAILALQLSTGVRISEAVGLKINQIVSRQGHINRKITFSGHQRKQNVSLTIPFVNPIGHHYITLWLQKVGIFSRTDYLFKSPYETGRSLTTRRISQIYSAAFDELQIPDLTLATHSIRKTWCRYALDYYAQLRRDGQNIDPLEMVRRDGGWSSLGTLKHYLNWMDAETAHAHLFPNLCNALAIPTTPNKETP